MVTPSRVAELVNVLGELAAGGGVEAGGGFVHDQDLGLVEQGFGDLDTALQAAGEGVHQVFTAVLHAQARHRVLHAVAESGAARDVKVALAAKVLFHGQGFVQALGLEDYADVRRTAADSRVTSWPAMMARPSVGTIMVERMRKRVDLPPPLGPRQAEDLAFFYCEVDVLERRHGPRSGV